MVAGLPVCPLLVLHGILNSPPEGGQIRPGFPALDGPRSRAQPLIAQPCGCAGWRRNPLRGQATAWPGTRQPKPRPALAMPAASSALPDQPLEWSARKGLVCRSSPYLREAPGRAAGGTGRLGRLARRAKSPTRQASEAERGRCGAVAVMAGTAVGRGLLSPPRGPRLRVSAQREGEALPPRSRPLAWPGRIR